MNEQRFDEAKQRLEEIVTEVRQKDTTLERAIDLLEEGVRLANVCTERIDETGWREELEAADTRADSEAADDLAGAGAEASATEDPEDPVLE